MVPHDPYLMKAVEYLVAVGFLLLFIPFWRLVNSEAAPIAERIRAWSGQLADWFRIPEGVYFHPGHAWAKLERAGVMTVGLDDFAQQLVGPLAGVDLPQPGAQLAAGARGWSIRGDGKSVDMLAPVTGTVLAVNDDAAKRPTLVNDDPYGRGWLLKIGVPQPSDVRSLLSGAAARAWIERVSQQLMASMSPELGQLCQDGGMPVHGLARGIDEEHWDDIARTFLLTAPAAPPSSTVVKAVTTALVALALALCSTAALRAQTLPRLPDELKLARSADSPGQVIFNHSTHVDSSRPDCTVCHPREFRILKANAGKRPIRHEEFEKGRQCASCHDGKKAFALDADCTFCHRG